MTDDEKAELIAAGEVVYALTGDRTSLRAAHCIVTDDQHVILRRQGFRFGGHVALEGDDAVKAYLASLESVVRRGLP